MHNWQAQVGEAQRGDLAAFEGIVRRFQHMAVGYAYTVLGDFNLAEDAAQEAFIQAYRDLAALQEPRAFPAWLRRIVVGRCDRLMRRKRLSLVPLETAGDPPDPGASPLEAIQRRELHEAVLGAIRALPESERAATTLFYINGYSMAEVGEFLEVPVGTVKSRLHSARRRLQERMVEAVEGTLKQHAPGNNFARDIRSILEGVPRVGWFYDGPRTPEETMFPACLRAVLEFLGDDCGILGTAEQKDPWHNVYLFIMGASGAAFRLTWDAAHWECGNPDVIYMAADPVEPFRRAFAAVGRAHEIVLRNAYADKLHFQGERCDEEAYYRRRIVETIRSLSRPVIGLGIVGPPECCIITGYDDGGDALLGWSFFQYEFKAKDPDLEIEPSGYFRKRNWFKDTHGLIVIGDPQPSPPLDEVYAQALPLALKVMRTPRANERHSGLAAYEAWAEAILRDQDWPADDIATLHDHLTEHNLASVTVAEGRYCGAEFLGWIAARAPAMGPELQAAIGCLRAEMELMMAVWQCAGYRLPSYSDDDARRLGEPGVRRQIAPLILQARAKDAEAAEHIERALQGRCG